MLINADNENFSMKSRIRIILERCLLNFIVRSGYEIQY